MGGSREPRQVEDGRGLYYLALVRKKPGTFAISLRLICRLKCKVIGGQVLGRYL
jgi:hypothetical protein